MKKQKSTIWIQINGARCGAVCLLILGMGSFSQLAAFSHAPRAVQATPAIAVTPAIAATPATPGTRATPATPSTSVIPAATPGQSNPPAFVEQAPPDSSNPRQTVKEMVETIARLDSAAAGVLGEVSRHQQVMVENRYRQYDLSDDVSGVYMGTPEEEYVGPALPPRKRWIDYHVQQLQNLLGILTSELSSLSGPSREKDSKKAELRAQLDVAHDSETSMSKDLTTLKSLIVGPTYDNAQISRVANHFRQELAGINSVRKRLIRLL